MSNPYADITLNCGDRISFAAVHQDGGNYYLIGKRFNGEAISIPVELQSYMTGMTFEDGQRLMGQAMQEAVTKMLNSAYPERPAQEAA